jgi:hypothetical protein
MQDKFLYEYAVIRIVPRVEREEFVNTGIILFCKRAKYIKVLYRLNVSRLECFSDELDLSQLEHNMVAFEKISLGINDGGPIAQLEVAERFRWLTAVRSSVIQTSKTHPGMCDDLDKTIERLFRELVLM